MTIEIKRGVRYFKGEGAQVAHMKARAVESFAEERLTHRQKLSNGWMRGHFGVTQRAGESRKGG